MEPCHEADTNARPVGGQPREEERIDGPASCGTAGDLLVPWTPQPAPPPSTTSPPRWCAAHRRSRAGRGDVHGRIRALVDHEAALLDAGAPGRARCVRRRAVVRARPLEPRLRDPGVDGVMVNGVGPVWVRRSEHLEATDVAFPSGRAAVRRRPRGVARFAARDSSAGGAPACACRPPTTTSRRSPANAPKLACSTARASRAARRGSRSYPPLPSEVRGPTRPTAHLAPCSSVLHMPGHD